MTTDQSATAQTEAEERPAVERLREEAEKLVEDDGNLGDLSRVLHGRNGSARIDVLPPLDWDFDAEEHLAAGEYPAYMRAVLDEENYAKVREVRPSNFHILQFITGVQGGEDLGESPAS